jgi:hypothetical protein
MVDREKVLVVLRRRFPAARSEDVAAAANAIVGLEPEYRAVDPAEVQRLECRTCGGAFGVEDIASGRLRLFLRA